MRLESQFTVTAPPEQAWEQVLDAGELAGCLPRIELRQASGDGVYAGRMSIGENGSRVVCGGTLQAIDADADERSASVRIQGREIGGAALGWAIVNGRVVERGGSTQVLISADLSLTGQRVSPEVLQSSAQQVLDEFARGLERRIQDAPVSIPDAVGAPTPPPAQPAAEPRPPLGDRTDAGGPEESLDLGAVLIGPAGRYGLAGGVIVLVLALLRVLLGRPRRGVSVTFRYRW
jgi:carbon monoxide dehydrogenase subunit G